MSSSPLPETGFQERIQYARDLASACHMVLEEVFRTSAFEHGVIVVRHEDQLEAVAQGVPEERLRALTARDGASAQLLRDLLDAGETRTLPGHELPETGFELVTVVSFPDPHGLPSVALLLDDPGPRRPAALNSAVPSVGPALARIHETDRLRKRLELVERHASLQDTVVDSLADPVLVTDSHNRIQFANRRAEHLFSARSHQSEECQRAARVNEVLFTSFLTQPATHVGELANKELNLVNPTDGSDLLFEVFTINLSGDAWEAGTVIKVLRDVTDLKRALAELELEYGRSREAERRARRESERLNVILTNVSDPIVVTNMESKIILMNAEARRLFDASQDRGSEPEVATWHTVRANDTKFTTLISGFLLQKATRRTENLVLHDPVNGREIPIEVLSSKIMSSRGEVSAIVSVLHDLTAVEDNVRLASELQVLNEGLEERIRLATEELEERNRRLEWQSRELQKASRLKSEFLASMSHELRTPINAMLGYTALMREKIYGELNEKQENALRKVYSASQHLLALINDILDLSRIEAGKMPVRVEQVRLDALVHELSQAIEPMVREKRLRYRTELSEDLPVLRMDRTKVKQILLNLLSNAVKFTPAGSVTLRARLVPGGEHFQVEVEDTGIGIREEDLETIFDDFRQVDQSSTRQYGGTGLGLSITRKLVRLMKGSITVDSQQGVGSTFRIELPLRLFVEEGEAALIETNLSQ